MSGHFSIPESTIHTLVNQLKFDEKGLIPTIVQDAKTLEILMFAFMNRESLQQTLQKGLATYYSRSRKKLWLKGETSNHYQHIKKIFTDCDYDCLLLQIHQDGVACHTGSYSCFFNQVHHAGWVSKTDKE